MSGASRALVRQSRVWERAQRLLALGASRGVRTGVCWCPGPPGYVACHCRPTQSGAQRLLDQREGQARRQRVPRRTPGTPAPRNAAPFGRAHKHKHAGYVARRRSRLLPRRSDGRELGFFLGFVLGELGFFLGFFLGELGFFLGFFLGEATPATAREPSARSKRHRGRPSYR